MDTSRDVYIQLQELLDVKGISQRELARRTGIRYPTISEMCLNKTSRLPIENIAKICDALDCEIQDLLVLVPKGMIQPALTTGRVGRPPTKAKESEEV